MLPNACYECYGANNMNRLEVRQPINWFLTYLIAILGRRMVILVQSTAILCSWCQYKILEAPPEETTRFFRVCLMHQRLVFMSHRRMVLFIKIFTEMNKCGFHPFVVSQYSSFT